LTAQSVHLELDASANTMQKTFYVAKQCTAKPFH